jgi:hypothetical protein
MIYRVEKDVGAMITVRKARRRKDYRNLEACMLMSRVSCDEKRIFVES